MSEFRGRLGSGGATAHLLDELLRVCQSKGWCADSTHVLAAVRQLNRLEVVGETLRHCLEVLAITAPDWLLCQVDASWLERYGSRVEQTKLAKSSSAQVEMVIANGFATLSHPDSISL